MRNKKLVITLVIVLSISVVGILGAVNVLAAKSSSVRPLEELALMDLTHENFAEQEAVVPAGYGGSTQTADVGDTEVVEVSDDYYGAVYNETFVVVEEGINCYILITADAYASWDGENYYFDNPFGTWGFDQHVISGAQLEYMRDEFDYNIYPTITTIYGTPDPRPELDSEGHKIWILIFNIKDWAYYEDEAEYYIAGYFSASTSGEENKNIIHIDTYYWADRVGPGVGRPYLYEGTIAHEFEHLAHYDIDPTEPSWVDEGLADLAGYFCGYGHSSGHLAYYMVYHPFTSLTFWGSSLEDYGISYLFQLYLYEKYGGAGFTSALVQEQADGIQGIQNTLDVFAPGVTFDEVYDDWTIANYLDDPDGGLYGYDTLDIGTADTWGYSIEWALENFWVGGPFEVPTGFYASWMFGTPMPYLPTYYRFGGPEPLRVALDGDELAGPGPYSGAYAWYSDVGAWAWRAFYQTFSIPALGETKLKFMTYFEIEDYWDFGYVEVHNLGTDEWTTLAAPGITVDVDPFDQDNPNVDPGRDPQDYLAAGEWNAFTGHSITYDTDADGWIPIEMNLTAFAGNDIELFFTSWQDGAFTYQGMYVDDIEITNGVFTPADDVESGPGYWLTRADFDGGDTWYIFDCYEDNYWNATLIETLWQPTKRYPNDQNWHARKLLNEVHMDMDFATQSGEITGIRETPVTSRRTQVLIVSNRADHILPADYWVEFTFA